MFLWGRFLGCVEFEWRCRMCGRFLSVFGVLFFSFLSQPVYPESLEESAVTNIARIELVREKPRGHEKIVERSTLEVDPESFFDFQILGYDRFGTAIPSFDFNPEVMIIADNPDRVYYAFLDRLSDRSHHYRLYVDAELNTKFMVRIFDRRFRGLKQDFFVNVDYVLKSMRMYLEDEGYHRYLTNGETIRMEPQGNLVFEVRGFDRNGKQLDEFQFDPEVIVTNRTGTDPYVTLERLTEQPGLHYRLTTDSHQREPFEIVIHDHRRHDLEQRFLVRSKYTLQEIRMYLEDEGYHRYLKDGETLSLQPYESVVFEVRGFDELGRQLNTFEFDPRVTLQGDHSDHDCLMLQKLPGPGLHYRLTADGDSYERVSVVIHDHSRHDLEKRFYAKLSYELQKIQMYLEDEGYRRFLEDGDNISLEPNGSFVFEVQGFDATGRRLSKFEFQPDVRVIGGERSYINLVPLAGSERRYRLSVDGQVRDKFEVRVYDKKRPALEKRFFVRSHYILDHIKLHLHDDFRRDLRDDETISMEPGRSLELEVHGYDERGNELNKFSFTPIVRSSSWDHDYVLIEKLSGYTHRYRLTTCSLHEHDRFEVTVRDSVRTDVRRRFYITSATPFGRVERMQISVNGRRLPDGEKLTLREGDSVAFVIEGLDSRGRLLPKDRFAPSVELRNYSGSPRDAYLEMLPGNEHAYRLQFLHASDRGDLEVRVTETGNQARSVSFFVGVNRPPPPRPDNPKIVVTGYQNDANATRLQLSGQLEDFEATSGHVETSHETEHGSVYPIRLRAGQFATDYIELPPGGRTTITLKLVNAHGDEITSVGLARYGNRGYRGFETTEYKRGAN